MAKSHESEALKMERKLIINTIESIYNYARAFIDQGNGGLYHTQV